MERQISVGAVIVNIENGQPRYLVLFRAGDKHHRPAWTLSRGKMERSEYKKQTAVREIREETGISDLHFLPRFREKMSWHFREKDPLTGQSRLVFKTAYFYLARTSTTEIKLSSEHQKSRWLDFDQALKCLPFSKTKKILTRAHEYLLANNIISAT